MFLFMSMFQMVFGFRFSTFPNSLIYFFLIIDSKLHGYEMIIVYLKLIPEHKDSACAACQP